MLRIWHRPVSHVGRKDLAPSSIVHHVKHGLANHMKFVPVAALESTSFASNTYRTCHLPGDKADQIGRASSNDGHSAISGARRNCLSRFWTPSIKARKSESFDSIDGAELLVRCGFVQQTASGLFHYLPLGLRVLEKLERLVDTHMLQLGASKVSLSSLSSRALWERSGRWNANGQFFQLRDAKGADFVLSPTHEEEITELVASLVTSYREVPLRLYQVTRKYRDELRPREGLLRGREFLMKDLYTFDSSETAAHTTYVATQSAYEAFFRDLKLNVIVADATSGTMGGKFSHEYHLLSSKGEDLVATCSNCGHTANEDTFRTQARDSGSTASDTSKHTSGPKCDVDSTAMISPASQFLPSESCPKQGCNGKFEFRQCVELAHTFYLGTKYSEACGAKIATASTVGHGSKTKLSQNQQALSMGCYGIGLSRLFGAVAHEKRDGKGLNWPRLMAPFEVIVLAASQQHEAGLVEIYDQLSISSTQYPADCVIDDRRAPFGTKIKDADLIGYPVIVILGDGWTNEDSRTCEVQCRQLQYRAHVKLSELQSCVQNLLQSL